MRIFLISICFIGLFFACRRSPNPTCHSQVLHEKVMPVYLVGTPGYEESDHWTIHCAGKCPDGTPCDSIVENGTGENDSQFRIVRCGCENQRVNKGCGIFIYHYSHPADSSGTLLLCEGILRCPVESDRCNVQEQLISSDTIRSRLTGRDSIIIMKWVKTCECV